ncbi:hypothetical protein VIGAN_06066500 [Vigna angularis var. angularis]|uniref:Pentatricopeptide repeat-containing protein n=1 Tax=Vigna angularis var. angularis TaxID=157739 RepID=A0A0S3S9V0_PHAAN|nr:hypothetical protein VIGAN_06066500 [Vigna angularis var. angularis]
MNKILRNCPYVKSEVLIRAFSTHRRPCLFSRYCCKPNTVVISAIVGMYLKCGRLETARRVFNSTGNKQDVELWNTILSTLTHYGYIIEAITMLYNMLRSGVKPNRTTFSVILNASSHSGLV